MQTAYYTVNSIKKLEKKNSIILSIKFYEKNLWLLLEQQKILLLFADAVAVAVV